MIRKIIKFVYNFIPFKKYLFLFIRSLYIPKQSLYQHLTFKGIFRVALENSNFKIYNTGTFIENQLFWKGIDGFEPNSLKIWIKLCRMSDVIFDLGANTGIYSLIAKSEKPTSTVYAFEPVEMVYTILSKNSSINKFDINCYRKAVSNKDGIGEFYDDDEEHQCSVIINLDRSDEKHLHRVEVEIVKLDSFIEDNNIQKIDLIKMDVETHESEVIDGFSSHLVHYKPSMIVEIIRDFTASHLQDKLSNLGYNYFYINESITQNVKDIKSIYQKVDSLIGGKYGNYLIVNNNVAKELNLI